jgi:hypothetical protein
MAGGTDYINEIYFLNVLSPESAFDDTFPFEVAQNPPSLRVTESDSTLFDDLVKILFGEKRVGCHKEWEFMSYGICYLVIFLKGSAHFQTASSSNSSAFPAVINFPYFL